MRFHPNDDFSAFVSVLDQVAEDEAAAWRTSPEWARFEWSQAFDDLMEANGFLDCASEDSLGLVAAVAMTHRVARLPVAAECAASAVLRPLFAPDLPRPIAVIEGSAQLPTRFLPVAKSALLIADGEVRRAILDPGAVSPVESIFAYPMGVLTVDAIAWEKVDADATAVVDAWRIALAAEIGGALKAGLDCVIEHVRQRHQFGRPLGSFQAIQHRLAAAAGKIEACYWLALKAAQRLGPADAAIAVGYAQEASTKIVYDLHQFMGAMGLTLEHPLHRWTYRVRLLRSALGGAAANLQSAAETRWRAA
jgi:hypothetical protein